MKKIIMAVMTVLFISSVFILSACVKIKNPTMPGIIPSATITATSTLGAADTATLTSTATPQDTATITATSTDISTDTMTATITMTATATATATNTPNEGTITGALILPAAAPGLTFYVMVDNDLDYTNGVINGISGTCGGTTNVPYSVNAAAGTYYVYGIVNVTNGIFYYPIEGDYVGTYGAVYPLFSASANVAVTAGNTTASTDITMAVAAYNVTGTITLPASADLRNTALAMDNDANPYNGGLIYLMTDQIPSGLGTTYVYNAVIVFQGSWYIHAIVENSYYGPMSGNFVAPITGDFTGSSGPHVMDPAASNGPYDFTLTTY